MNCTDCSDKVCRKQQNSGNIVSFDKSETNNQNKDISNCEIVKVSAQLFEHRRAGALLCIEEISEFTKSMNYKKIGLA